MDPSPIHNKSSDLTGGKSIMNYLFYKYQVITNKELAISAINALVEKNLGHLKDDYIIIRKKANFKFK